MCVTEGN